MCDGITEGLIHKLSQVPDMRVGMWREALEAWQKGLASSGKARTAELMARAYTQGGYESALQVWLADLLTEVHAH